MPGGDRERQEQALGVPDQQEDRGGCGEEVEHRPALPGQPGQRDDGEAARDRGDGQLGQHPVAQDQVRRRQYRRVAGEKRDVVRRRVRREVAVLGDVLQPGRVPVLEPPGQRRVAGCGAVHPCGSPGKGEKGQVRGGPHAERGPVVRAEVRAPPARPGQQAPGRRRGWLRCASGLVAGAPLQHCPPRRRS